jgi:hypothetical protein
MVQLEVLGKLKKEGNGLIGTWSGDLPACSSCIMSLAESKVNVKDNILLIYNDNNIIYLYIFLTASVV